MPRIYDSESNAHDFCKKCFPSESEAEKKFRTSEVGPDNRGDCYSYDEMHPVYEKGDKCTKCNKQLKETD